MDTYKGFVEINDTQYPFVFSNFLLVISTGRDDVSWEYISSIVIDGKIRLFDNRKAELILFADRYQRVHLGEYGIHVTGFILCYSFEDNAEVAHFSTIRNMMFKHPAIDYFFRSDALLLDRYIELLNLQKSPIYPGIELPSRDIPYREGCKFTIEQKEIVVEFGATSRFEYEKPFPFTLFNIIYLKCEEGMNIDEAFKAINIIKLFLCLISQANAINLDCVLLNLNTSYPSHDAMLYLRPEEERPILKNRVLDYENIKSGIENIFSQIIANQICFRSLFDTSITQIHIHDIVNICAAFEAQFELTNPKFKDKEQRAVKRKMINDLNALRKNYSDVELEHFDTVLEGFKNFSDTLKLRLQTALGEFVRICGKTGASGGFKKDYQQMPERIKNARNAIAHGNLEHPLIEAAFTDTELVRAIIYMLILQEAKIDDWNIGACLKKLSGFPM